MNLSGLHSWEGIFKTMEFPESHEYLCCSRLNPGNIGRPEIILTRGFMVGFQIVSGLGLAELETPAVWLENCAFGLGDISQTSRDRG